MEDAQAPVMNTPSGVKYSDLISQAVDAVSTERRFVPQNATTFNPTNVRHIRIPITIPAGHFIDTSHSFLRFKIKNNTPTTNSYTAPIIPDPHWGTCLFRNLKWEGSDGAQLESLNHYNLLTAQLYQLQVGQDHYGTLGSILQGHSTDSALSGGKPIKTGESFTCSTPLVSAFWNSHRYLPLGWVKGSAVNLELELDDAKNCFYQADNASKTAGAATAAEYSVENVELVLHTVYFNSQFNATFEAMLNSIGGIQWSSTGYNSLISILGAGSEVNVNLPVRAMSLKGLLHSMQDTVVATTQAAFALSARTSRLMKNYIHYIGGASFPIQKVEIEATNQGHALSELLKMFGTLGSIAQGSKLIDGPGDTGYTGAAASNAYYPNTVGGTADNQCAFMFGNDFENFPGDHMLSGLDMSSQAMPVNLRAEVTASTTTGKTTILTTFVHSDVIFTLTSDGVISVSN